MLPRPLDSVAVLAGFRPASPPLKHYMYRAPGHYTVTATVLADQTETNASLDVLVQ
jgi:hypothetical protein